MKRTIIFSAFMTMLLSAGFTSAQTSGLRLSFSEDISPAGVPTGTVQFFVDGTPVLQVFEALIPATTEAACFASRDFSSARPVGPDRASVTYDPATSSHTLKWTGARDKRDSCRVLLVGQSIASSDLAVWQANYGRTELGGNPVTADVQGGSGWVWQIQISPASASGSGSSVLVKYPGQDGEVIEVAFPEAANSNFRLLEKSFPSRSEAECLANGDFSGATPVGSDRATIGYFPSSGLWQVRNNYTGLTTVQCHALIVDGDATVDAGDYAVWRTNFGSSHFGEGDGFLTKEARGADGKPGPIGGATVTYTYMVTNTSPSF